MSLEHFFNQVKMYIDAAMTRQPTPKLGILIGVQMNPPMGRVNIKPGTGTTGWLPFALHGGGNGWGLVNIPKVGVQVALMPLDGDSDSYVIVGSSWSSVTQVPTNFAPGDIGMVHSSGDYIQITQAGEIASRGNWVHQGNFTVQPNPNSSASPNGDVIVTVGDVLVDQGNITAALGSVGVAAGNITVPTGDVIIAGVGHKQHKHPGVTTGGGDTSIPVAGP